jgi:hypothetical protein
MSDEDRWLTSRAPWVGQRTCVKCWKVSMVDGEGVCQACRTDERRQQEMVEWLADQFKKGGDKRQ